MSVKFKSLLLLKASDTMLKCFGGGFLFVSQAGPYPHRVWFFFIWRTLHFQEGFYSSGVECSVDKAAVSQLAAWSLQSEPYGWTAVPAATCPKGIPSTDQAAGSGGPLAWVLLSMLRSSSFARKAPIINLSKHLLIFVVNLFLF